MNRAAARDDDEVLYMGINVGNCVVELAYVDALDGSLEVTKTEECHPLCCEGLTRQCCQPKPKICREFSQSDALRLHFKVVD